MKHRIRPALSRSLVQTLAQTLALTLLLACLVPGIAAAQDQAADTADTPPRKGWFVFGGAKTALRGDCTFCEVEGREGRYTQTWSLVADAGVRVNPKVDVGLELVWVPADTRDGDTLRTTFLIGVVQARPWETQGFFVKGGIGMAFVRNWVFDTDPSIRSRALAVAIGAGWAFRRDERLGFEVFGTQHAAALGDFQTRDERIENVMGNYWSLGAAVVIR
jgi:hypothetical protein